MTSRTGSARGILKKSGELSSTLLAEARPVALWWVRTRCGEDGKARIKRLCLSLPYVEKPFNSKVIKGFMPELGSRKCFSCFRIPMFYVYIYEHSMYVSTYPYLAMVQFLPLRLGDYMVRFTNPSARAGYDM